MELENSIKKYIREVPDFPKEGILFKDFTPLLLEPGLCRGIVEALKNRYKDQRIDQLVAIESRGFIFGSMLASALNVPMVLARKMGKLPADTISQTYQLEYGSATMEIHKDSIQPNSRVLIHDDLLATGGTTEAVAKLVQTAGGVIAGYDFIIELESLEGRQRLMKNSETSINSLVKFP